VAEVAEAPRWESGWRVLCPERRASEREWGKRRVSEEGVGAGCMREALYPRRHMLVFELHLLKQSGT
jgi:hypothetical protein